MAIGNVLVEAAAIRPVVVYCDDAYHGLVFEPSATTKSLFFELIDRSPNLIPLKCDGATKELSFFGGRVSFLHFGVDKAIAEILVDKCMGPHPQRPGRHRGPQPALGGAGAPG